MKAIATGLPFPRSRERPRARGYRGACGMMSDGMFDRGRRRQTDRGWVVERAVGSLVSDVPEDARFAVGSGDRRVLAMNGDRLEREDA